MLPLTLTIFLVYALYAFYLYNIQRNVLYPAPRPPSYDVAAGIPGLLKFWLKTSFGEVEAWYLPPSSSSAEPAPVMIFTHGNGELIDHWPPMFAPVAQMGVGVLLVEFPGYGRSAGSPSQSTIEEAILTAYDTAITIPGVDPERIVAYGRSLGGGASCILTDQRPVAALILQSSFTSTRSFARYYLLPGFLIRDQFDNLSVVKRFSGPVLIIHGKYDRQIPYQHGQTLAGANPNAELITLPCGHNDCPQDWAAHWESIAAFLRTYGLLPQYP
ncbi:alpha/beta hydrolase [Chloroflexota bacterium]